MSKMLKFDPKDRIDVNAALEHPWLSQLHDCTAEPVHPHPIVFGFEDDNLTGDQVSTDWHIYMLSLIHI